jgi:hypothetical protein
MAQTITTAAGKPIAVASLTKKKEDGFTKDREGYL